MKIIIVGTAYPYRGGLATFNERLAYQFQTEGHDVEIITFTLQYPAFLFPGKTQFSEDEAPSSLKISRQINTINPFNWVKVAKNIREKKPDLVIFAYWMSFVAPCFGSIARLIKKDNNIKRIALVHNMLPHEPSLIDNLLSPYFVTAIDEFIALSKSVVNDIEKIDKKKKPKRFSPHPIYNHYGELLTKVKAAKQLQLDENNSYLLFFGFIRSYKGLDLLLEALGDERLKNWNAKLIVAGEFYEDSKLYMEIIERLQLQNRVILHTSFIANKDVNAYFSIADLIVQPYKTATQSGVTQIAYHFEKPMLVTNVGGLSEIVPQGKAGYVAEPNVKSIADALVEFYTNPSTFSEGIKQEKQKYTWDKLTKIILSLN
ncbi:MAG TPA: glycosyltransferase [Paludibacteraceae bacterium]|nr:glycosyltransferase [Paludibacteraceae bacterium]